MSHTFKSNSEVVQVSTYRHWLPILTFCPVNKLPDLLYVSIETEVATDLYAVRKRIRKLISKRLIFMEDAAHEILNHFQEDFPDAVVTVRLAFNRHQVVVHA